MEKKILSLTMVIVAACGGLPLRATRPLQIAISSPQDGVAIPWRTCVSGTVSDPSAEVWLVIGDKSGNFYVQPGPLSVKPNGVWSGRPYIAEKKPALFNGLNLEMRAIANPTVRLAEGMVLDLWPSGQASSPVIDVVYEDEASDGCLTPTSSAMHKNSQHAPRLSVDSAESPSQPVVSGSYINLALLQLSIKILCVVLSMVFVALVALPDKAAGAVDGLTKWLRAFVTWFVTIALASKESIVRLWYRLFSVGKTQTHRIWEARGFTLDFRVVSFELVAIAPLMLAVLLAFYSESATIVKSLDELFGVESDAVNAVQPGFATNLMSESSDSSRVGEPQSASTPPIQNPLVRVAVGWFGRLSRAFERLWESEPLAFLAMALAALQASSGIVLLWGMGFAKPLKVSLKVLLHERPLATEIFLVLTLALTALAAFRGAKVTVGPSWVLSMCVSAALALVLPAILGLTSHYALEAASDCTALAKVFTVITVISFGLGAVVALWTLALLLVLAAVGIALAAFATLFVLAALYLLFAELMGNFLRQLRGIRLSQIGSARASRVATVLVVTLVSFALAAYFLMEVRHV